MENIKIDSIHQNDWNPNQLTDQELDELIAEVKHLGRLPKPMVLRRNEAGFEIVDGEQSYKAIKALAWGQLPAGQYEIIEASDFEAMRQTYKRNQHGTHNKLLEGQLFKRMMETQGISQRELADQIDLSEGTIRNALEYVKAAEVRNGYAEHLSQLSIRTVRDLNRLPVEMGDLWLNTGTKDEDYPGTIGWDLPGGPSWDRELSPLIPLLHVKTCSSAMDVLDIIGEGLRLWGFYGRGWDSRKREYKKCYRGGLKIKSVEALPYLILILKSRWFGSKNYIAGRDIRDIFEAISRPAGDRSAIVLPMERLAEWIDYPEGMSLEDFKKHLTEAASEYEAPASGADIWKDQLEKYAPVKIRESGLDTEAAYILWQEVKAAKEWKVDEEAIDQALDQALEAAKQTGIKNPDLVFRKKLEEFKAEGEIEAELESLGTRNELLEMINNRFMAEMQLYAMGAKLGADSSKMIKELRFIADNKNRLLARLDALDDPELALIAAMLTGKDYIKIWVKAIDQDDKDL